MQTTKLQNRTDKPGVITCWQFFRRNLKIRMPAMLETYTSISGELQLYRKTNNAVRKPNLMWSWSCHNFM